MNEPEPEEALEMGTLTVKVGKESSKIRRTEYTLQVDRLAALRDGLCYLLSVVGPGGAIKGLRAALNADVTVELTMKGVHVENDEGNGGWVKRIQPERSCGYALRLATLGHGHYHGLFTSRQPGFLPVASDDALYDALKQPTLTTPLLRPWVPAIARALREGGLLKSLYGYRCRSALLTATTADLDTIVTQAVRNGTCTFLALHQESP